MLQDPNATGASGGDTYHDCLCNTAQFAEDAIRQGPENMGLNVDGIYQGNHLSYQGREITEAAKTTSGMKVQYLSSLIGYKLWTLISCHKDCSCKEKGLFQQVDFVTC